MGIAGCLGAGKVAVGVVDSLVAVGEVGRAVSQEEGSLAVGVAGTAEEAAALW